MDQAVPSTQAEGAPNSTKACAVCKIWQPVSSYSGAQLKKQGKRTCRACVEKANPPQPSQPPPLSIAAADRVTAEEIHSTLPRLIAQVASLGVHALAPLQLQASAFTAICEIYPPNRTFAWWDAGDASAIKHVKLQMGGFMAAMWKFVQWASEVYSLRAIADATTKPVTTPPQQRSTLPFFSPPVYCGESVFEDASRLVHKMLIHWIYFMQHFPFECKTHGQQLYNDISHQHYGHKHTHTDIFGPAGAYACLLSHPSHAVVHHELV